MNVSPVISLAPSIPPQIYPIPITLITLSTSTPNFTAERDLTTTFKRPRRIPRRSHWICGCSTECTREFLPDIISAFSSLPSQRLVRHTCKFCVETLGKTTGTGTKGKSIRISIPAAAYPAIMAAVRDIANSFIFASEQINQLRGKRKEIDRLINQSINWIVKIRVL